MTAAPVEQDAEPLLTALLGLARDFGAPLLDATSADQLDAIAHGLADDVMMKRFFETTQIAVHALPGPAPEPGELLADAERELRFHFGRTPTGLIAQAIEVTVELINRMSPHVAQVAAHFARVDRAESEIPPLDNEARELLRGVVYTLAVVHVLSQPKTELVDPKLQAGIVKGWFEGFQKLLAAIDPLQCSLDRAVARFPVPSRDDVMRLTYRFGEDSLGQAALIVWLVLREETPRQRRLIGGDPAVAMEIVTAVRGCGVDAQVFVRARLASEPPPSAWGLDA